jgi:hypothetical protein
MLMIVTMLHQSRRSRPDVSLAVESSSTRRRLRDTFATNTCTCLRPDSCAPGASGRSLKRRLLNEPLCHLNTHSEQFNEPLLCPACLQEDRRIEIRDAGGWIIHVANVHGGSKVLGAVLKSSYLETNAVPVDATEVQHQKELHKRRKADMKRKAGGASSSHPPPS